MSLSVAGGYNLVETVFDLETVTLPFVIDDQLRIERPTGEQIDEIRKIGGALGVDLGPFECSLEKVPQESGFALHRVPLPPDRLRYLLITHSTRGLEVHEFEQFLSILDPPVRTTFHAWTTEAFGRGQRSGYGWQALKSRRLPVLEWDVQAISDDWLGDVKNSWLLYSSARRTFPFLEKAVKMIHDLDTIPRTHDLYFLGLFAIVELLLTHNPNDKENADSLRHQISTKVPLLSSRMIRKPKYGAFEDGLAEEKLWKLPCRRVGSQYAPGADQFRDWPPYCRA